MTLHIDLRPRRANLFAAILDRLRRLRRREPWGQTAAAVARLSQQGQREVLRALSGATVSWSGGTFKVNRLTGGLYRAAAQGLEYPVNGDRLHGRVVIDHPRYAFVRDGMKAFDMKPGLLRSPKAKVVMSRRHRRVIRSLLVPIQDGPGGAVQFRRVTSESRGWIHPGTLPRRVDGYAAEAMRDRVRAGLREALLRDLGGRS